MVMVFCVYFVENWIWQHKKLLMKDYIILMHMQNKWNHCAWPSTLQCSVISRHKCWLQNSIRSWCFLLIFCIETQILLTNVGWQQDMTRKLRYLFGLWAGLCHWPLSNPCPHTDDQPCYHYHSILRPNIYHLIPGSIWSGCSPWQPWTWLWRVFWAVQQRQWSWA